jgi:hypothetical protein
MAIVATPWDVTIIMVIGRTVIIADPICAPAGGGDGLLKA